MPEPAKQREEAAVEVLADDPPREGDAAAADASKKRKDEEEDEDMSAEDRQLREDLELLVQRLVEPEGAAELRLAALNGLAEKIRTSTTSMTSIPKPLKFLRPHYTTIKEYYAVHREEAGAGAPLKGRLADLISVLGMTMGEPGERESLRFLLEARAHGRKEEVGSWGHNYVTHLAGELAAEWEARNEKRGVDEPQDAADAANLEEYADLYAIIQEVVPYNMSHGAETDAVDLLLEIVRVADIKPFVTRDNVHRVCDYIVTCSDYVAVTEDRYHMLSVAIDCFLQCGCAPEALRIVLRRDDLDESLPRVFEKAAGDETLRKQLALLMGAHRTTHESVTDDSDELAEISGNCHLHEHFLNLARELDVVEPKEPEDIYKSHLAEGGPMPGARRNRGGAKVDSAKANLASTFVNAFVNMGFGADKLVTPERSEWIYKNKDHGMMSAAASLGAINLWDVEGSFSDIDKYSYSANDNVKAGAMLATGIITAGVTSDMDAAYALLAEHLEGDGHPSVKIGAALGLGLAYAGKGRADVLECLVPLVVDGTQPMEVSSVAALALGLIFVGHGNEDLVDAVIQGLMDRSDTELSDSAAKMMALGLGLNLLGRGESCEATLDVVAVIEHPLKDYLHMMVEICAYAGSGNVLIVQKLLAAAGQHPDEEEAKEDSAEEAKEEAKDDAAAPAAAAAAGGAAAAAGGAAPATPAPAGAAPAAEADADEDKEQAKERPQNALAVLGIAMVTMHEELGAQMALRSMDHILQYAEADVRKAVPLALSLLFVSNPNLQVMDTLGKLSHDSDELVSQNALLALGFIGAGTNNSRIANLLRNASAYYAKEPNHLFLVRVAQGLLHMGKGLLTLDPIHSERQLLSHAGLAGLLTVLTASLDNKNNILGKRHYLLYALVASARPRMLVTVNEELEAVPVKVKVGQAVDVVGVAGRPKRLTGFQTHTTPVLLSYNDKAELATDEYIAVSPILEGFVIVKKNPDFVEEEEA